MVNTLSNACFISYFQEVMFTSPASLSTKPDNYSNKQASVWNQTK